MSDAKYKESATNSPPESENPAETTSTAHKSKDVNASAVSTKMKKALSFMNIQDASNDPALQKKRIGIIHSLIMGFCLFCLLMTILVTQEPYRYIRSNLAIQKGAHISTLQNDEDLNTDDVWNWFEAISNEIGGNTYKEVVANCGYNPYASQTINVDGTNYTVVNPVKQDSACAESNIGFISGRDDPLYLIGSHQLLAAGFFTRRANTNFPIKGSVADVESTLEINSDKSEPLNPIKDNKVVEVCSVLVEITNDDDIPPPPPPPIRRRFLQGDDEDDAYVEITCIHKDGIAVEDVPYTPGSTMNWAGQVVHQDFNTYYAFDADRKASFFEESSKSFTSYPPCFILDEDDGTVQSGVAEFNGTARELKQELTGCVNTWVSKGRDFRTLCLEEQNTGSQSTEQQSYLAGLFGTGTVPELYELFFGCESLINWDVSDIDNAFVEARRPIESYLEYDKSYGAFFPTASEQVWVEDALIGKTTLKMHGFLDKQTTEASVFFILRNLDGDALFYTLVKVSFEFRVNGYTNVKYHPIFSPIIQYEYGSDGYAWRNRQMYVWEVIFLILFSLFALREIYQLVFSRIIPFLNRLCEPAKVAPFVSHSTSNDAITSKSDIQMTNKGPNRRDDSPRNDIVNEGKDNYETQTNDDNCDEVHDLESCHDNNSTAEQSITKPDKRPKTAGMIDLNNDGIDDFEQLGKFMADLNDNGIDDAEEIMELVDEYLPDAAGMLDILDWLTIILVSVSIYIRVDYINNSGNLHEFFLEMAEEANYHESMTELIESFEKIDNNVTTMNLLVMFLVFFGLIQFFRYLSFDKRLGIVTATIKESLGSLLPILIIFLVVMFAYAILGTVMYGAHLNSWSNIAKSTSQLFLLILGEFGSYFDIMQINPILSTIFFWTYIAVAMFLLFNMVLAVIFTVYETKNTEIVELEAIQKEKEKEFRKRKEEEKRRLKEEETKKEK